MLADEIAAEAVSTDARAISLVVADAVSKVDEARRAMNFFLAHKKVNVFFLLQFGTTVAPFVVLLGGISPDLPLAVFGLIMIVRIVCVVPKVSLS